MASFLSYKDDIDMYITELTKEILLIDHDLNLLLHQIIVVLCPMLQ